MTAQPHNPDPGLQEAEGTETDSMPITSIAIDHARLRERAAVYRLLGRLWLHELDADLLRDLRCPPLSDAFAAAGGTMPPVEAESDTIDALAIDYCQLFLGPRGHLPPHQSVWADGQFQGPTTAALPAEFKELDLPYPGDMADHLGQQLTTMAVILERLAAEKTVAACQLDTASVFFQQRLNWTAELCKRSAAQAQTAFYRSVVTMTQAFLTQEHAAWLVVD